MKKLKKNPKLNINNLGLDEILNKSVCKAKDVIELYNEIKEYKNHNVEMLLVIRDVKDLKKHPNGSNIFKLPKPNIKKGKKSMLNELRKKLDEYTKDLELTSNVNIQWWKQIDLSAHPTNYGLLPLKAIKSFVNVNKNDKNILYTFRQEFSNELHKIPNDGKDTIFLFSKKYHEYCMEFKRPKSERDNNILQQLLIESSKLPMSRILELFWSYCLPNNIFGKSNKQLWLRSECMCILDDICSTRNRIMLYEPRKQMKQMRLNTNKNTNNFEAEQLLKKLATMEKEYQISSFDFFKQTQAICNLTYEYKGRLQNNWIQLPEYITTKITIFQCNFMELSNELFCSGVPIEFCDGDYIRMNQGFVRRIFQRNISGKTVACVAVAGPQSSGKSTLLRRLFGIEAKASAGRTTRGINCCGVNTQNVDILFVDTEGIRSVERTGNNNNGKEKKRDNKIVLTALASSRVFILNIMRDAKDTQMLDVILWAYDKLNPQQNKSNNSNRDKKNLTDVKFIFVIRDCQEYTNPTWLVQQTNSINQVLKDSLSKSPTYIAKNDDDEKYIDNITIQDIIGEPLYFPMPDAFDSISGAPNPEFSLKCIELRSIILKYLCDTNDRNSYKNIIDWSDQMCGIWDRIVQFEDVLSPADFRTQSHHQHMQIQVREFLKKLRVSLKDDVEKLQKTHLDNSNIDHDDRCESFKIAFQKLYNKQLHVLSTEMQTSPENTHINKNICKRYIAEFEDRSKSYEREQIDLFNVQSNRQQTLNIENEIIGLLNALKKRLKQQNIQKLHAIEIKYDKIFQQKIDEYNEYIKNRKLKQSSKRKFESSYNDAILIPNRSTGKIPSSQQQLDLTFKIINENNFYTSSQFFSTIKNNLISPPNTYKPFKQTIIDETEKLIKSINAKNVSNSDFLIHLIESLDGILNRFDLKHHSDGYRLSEDCRAASHNHLRNKIIQTLNKIDQEQVNIVIAKIQTTKEDRWEIFKADVLNMKNSRDHANHFLDGVLKKEVEVFAMTQIEKEVDAYFDPPPNAEKILQRAFGEAFAPQQSTDDAIEFILHPKSIITKEFEGYFQSKKNAFKNSSYITNLGTKIQQAVNEWIDFFEEWEEDIQITTTFYNKKLLVIDGYLRIKLNVSTNILNTQILQLCYNYVPNHDKPNKIVISNTDELQKKMKSISNTIPFVRTWYNADIANSEMFVATVLHRLKTLGDTKDSMYLKFIDECVQLKKENLRISSFGCMQFCPRCGAKCQLDANHSASKHRTEYHLLMAFTRSRHYKTKKLTVDVCSSKRNQTVKWHKNDDPFIIWPEYIKKYYPEWYPIDDRQNFDKENVLMMVNMYFKHLQDAMMQHDRWKNCKKATRTDVRCAAQIGWNP